MRLPKWFPAVSRPWNPSYREVWDSMTYEEKQWSCFWDICIVAVVTSIICWLAS